MGGEYPPGAVIAIILEKEYVHSSCCVEFFWWIFSLAAFISALIPLILNLNISENPKDKNVN